MNPLGEEDCGKGEELLFSDRPQIFLPEMMDNLLHPFGDRGILFVLREIGRKKGMKQAGPWCIAIAVTTPAASGFATLRKLPAADRP